MPVKTQPITIEEVMRSPPPGRWEIVRGELLTRMSGSAQHGMIAMTAGYLVMNYVRRRRLGVVFAAETGFVLERDPDTLRAPDVAFVGQARLADHADGPSGFFDGPPDLAVEVVSPSDRRGEVLAKVEQWLETGTGAVWVIWPRTRTATIHHAGTQTRTLEARQTLDGGEILPGFSCQVEEFFE